MVNLVNIFPSREYYFTASSIRKRVKQTGEDEEEEEIIWLVYNNCSIHQPPYHTMFKFNMYAAVLIDVILSSNVLCRGCLSKSKRCQLSFQLTVEETNICRLFFSFSSHSFPTTHAPFIFTSFSFFHSLSPSFYFLFNFIPEKRMDKRTKAKDSCGF